MTKQQVKNATLGRITHNGVRRAVVILNESALDYSETVQVRICSTGEYVIVRFSEISAFGA